MISRRELTYSFRTIITKGRVCNIPQNEEYKDDDRMIIDRRFIQLSSTISDVEDISEIN